MDPEKIADGLKLRREKREAQDKHDQATETYNRFLDSLTGEELIEYTERILDLGSE